MKVYPINSHPMDSYIHVGEENSSTATVTAKQAKGSADGILLLIEVNMGDRSTETGQSLAGTAECRNDPPQGPYTADKKAETKNKTVYAFKERAGKPGGGKGLLIK